MSKIDARSKPKVVPYKIIDLSPMYEEEDYEGDTTTYGKDEVYLQEILDNAKLANISPSEYGKIKISLRCVDHQNDLTIAAEYRVPKTQKEIDAETKEQQRLIDEKKKSLVAGRIEREKKKKEKQQILNSLTPEQKKALGIK